MNVVSTRLVVDRCIEEQETRNTQRRGNEKKTETQEGEQQKKVRKRKTEKSEGKTRKTEGEREGQVSM